MNLAEYIKGFLGIIAIIFFGIGIVVWKFRAADEIQEIEKKIDVDTKKVIESDLKVLRCKENVWRYFGGGNPRDRVYKGL